jgi:magnesium-transporting ATPase (P-type)
LEYEEAMKTETTKRLERITGFLLLVAVAFDIYVYTVKFAMRMP